MAFVIKFVKGVRNHWKKSTFAAIALTYGYNYTKDYYETQQLMREYCEKAAVYGRAPIPVNVNPRSVTVILNPNANRRKAIQQFEKYCAPILNLAGICVDIVQTESEGHAKDLMSNLAPTDAIIVAGGDGTLSEVITGLLRSVEENKNNLLPVGILPLGRRNTVSKYFFPGGEHLQNVRSLADASLAIVQECTKAIDVMKIEVIDENIESKPIYAVSGLQWGAYRDARALQDKYWYYGSFRKYATYVFNGYKDTLNWNCGALVMFTPPCDGCSNCCKPVELKQNLRWYHRLIGKKEMPVKDSSKIINEKCKEHQEKQISTMDFSLLTTMDSISKLVLNVGPSSIDYLDFVKQGWQSEQGQDRKIEEVIEARQIEIKPKIADKKEVWFSIDNEDFEAKAVRITLLPKIVQMFCKASENLV